MGDNLYHTACMAFQTSTGLGYRRPGLISRFQEEISKSEGAFTAAFLLHQRTLAAKDRVPVFTKNSQELMPWYKKYRPDILFSMYGGGVQQLGNRIPDEVGFVNLSGLDYGVRPDCTYAAQRTDLAGIAALDLVTGQLSRNERGWPQHPNCVIVPSEWHAGNTTRNVSADTKRPASAASSAKSLTPAG